MALVSFAPFVDGSLPQASDVYNLFYSLSAGAATNSLAVLNGFLDEENTASIGNREIEHIYLQRNSVSGGDMVAGTANLDFFTHISPNDGPGTSGIYAGSPDPETAQHHEYKVLPGGAIQFYLPFPAFVLLTWQVCWTNDSGNTGQESHMRLFVNGDPVGIPGNEDNSWNVRRVRRTMFRVSTSGSDNEQDVYLRDRYKSRYWSGHQWLPLPGDTPLRKGFHSASLRVIQHEDVKQTRVRARSMKVIYFKAKDN